MLANGNEAGIEIEGNGGSKDEAACVNTDDLVYFLSICCSGEFVDRVTQQFRVREDGRDVFKKNAWLGEVGNITNVVAEELGNGGHDGCLVF